MQLQKNKVECLVIGHGMLGRTISKRIAHMDDCLFFASGVSNSGEIDDAQYLREENLIISTMQAYPRRKFVYFSTVSVYDPFLRDRKYIQYKLKFEDMIKASCENYFIIRAPNVVGPGGNPNTLINFFVNSIRLGSHVTLWRNTERNFLGVDHLVAIVQELLTHSKVRSKNTTLDIIYPISFKPEFVFNEVENFLKLKGKYTLSSLGQTYLPSAESSIVSLFEKLNIPVGEHYIKYLLNQYYR